jgi:CDP-glucose 4,6-dehydratase
VGVRHGALESLEVSAGNPDPAFWRDKRVLLTGHTGFKGAWMSLWLHRLGATVVGLSLPPITSPNLFSLATIDGLLASHLCDIRDAAATAAVIRSADPEIVFHLAAQPLVRASYREPVATFATNVLGTAHVLDALRATPSVRAVVAITTDKVYANHERPTAYAETDPLGGHDPYSASKAAAEMVIASYRDSFLAARGMAVASARAGNVVGGGDWSEDRLIPDAVRAWTSGQTLHVRRPRATRPWQHVLEPVAAYLRLAEQLWRRPELAGPYNLGPAAHETATVKDVIEMARSAFGTGAVALADGDQGPHEAGCLALEIDKARDVLDVHPRWPLTTTITRTMQWYRAQHAGADARALCAADIMAYEAAAPGGAA